MKEGYDRLLERGRVYSGKHPPIPNRVRAAQFAPFAALTGYDDTIRETARLTRERCILSDSGIDELEERLQILRQHLEERPPVQLTWFVPDASKRGGAYRVQIGTVLKLELYSGYILLTDGTQIPLQELYALEGKIFEESEKSFPTNPFE